MPLLGIDYGEKHLGLAVALGPQDIFPLKSIPNRHAEQVIAQIKDLCHQYSIQQIIIGLPLQQGEIGQQAKRVQSFGDTINKKINLTVQYTDETLTSEQAKKEMLVSQVPSRKRKDWEHSFAAKSILAQWIENN